MAAARNTLRTVATQALIRPSIAATTPVLRLTIRRSLATFYSPSHEYVKASTVIKWLAGDWTDRDPGRHIPERRLRHISSCLSPNMRITALIQSLTQVDGDIGTVGITAHAADALGDIVFIDLPDEDSDYEKGYAIAHYTCFPGCLSNPLTFRSEGIDGPFAGSLSHSVLAAPCLRLLSLSHAFVPRSMAYARCTRPRSTRP